MIKVNIAIFLEVEFLSRYANESYDQTVHGHHQLNGDVGPDMLEIAGQHGVWPGTGSQLGSMSVCSLIVSSGDRKQFVLHSALLCR